MSYRRANRRGSRQTSIESGKSILLDTNVVSELIRKSPNPTVVAWTFNHSRRDLYFSAVGEAELRFGAAIIPPGRRRTKLISDIEKMLNATFGNRSLPFDSEAACIYADLAAFRRFAGRPIATADCQTAAIAQSHGMKLATRNSRDFGGMGIDVIDPWHQD